MTHSKTSPPPEISQQSLVDNLVADLRAGDCGYCDATCRAAADEIERLDHDHRLTHELLLKRNSQLNVCEAEIERLTAELAKAKAVPMKYRRMEFNAQLQKENARLRAALERIERMLPQNGWNMREVAREALAGASDSQQRTDISDGKA